MDIVVPVVLLGGAGLGAMLLIRNFQKTHPDDHQQDFAAQIGQSAGFALGSAATHAVGGAYQGYSEPIQNGLCDWAGGGGYDPATGKCKQGFTVGPITPDTPLLGGVVGFLTS